MAVPRHLQQMTVHTLEAPKGWPSPYAVDFTTEFDATQLAAITGNVAYAGRTVHLNASGNYEFGVANRSMGMWLFQNSDDPDVENNGGNPASDVGAWQAVAPTGKLTALVAAGAYELATTEFDTSKTYAPNDTLTAATGTTLATAGVLTNASATPYTNPVCGVVSRGAVTNAHGQSELWFWPVYIPVA